MTWLAGRLCLNSEFERHITIGACLVMNAHRKRISVVQSGDTSQSATSGHKACFAWLRTLGLLLVTALISVAATAATSNYTFTTATDDALTDMTGSAQLLGADLDDIASPVTSIGFDFYFQGVRYGQFSVNDNGALRLGPVSVQTAGPYQPLAQAVPVIITAWGADQRVHSTGRVHHRVIGIAPNRVSVIEWRNMQSNFNAGGTPDLTYQVRLFETSGAVEFVYGSMSLSATGAGAGDSNDPQFGFSSGNSAGNVGSVTAAQGGVPDPSFDGASAVPTNNLYVAGPITALTSASDGSRRVFAFDPPVPDAAPAGLNFSATTQVSTTLNWVDNATNELAYVIYRSTDGVVYSFLASAPVDAVSFVDASLFPGTSYFYRVHAVTEGALSLPTSGSVTTGAPGTIVSTAVGGSWSMPATWAGGIVPGPTDNVTIADGALVTIDTAAVALNVFVGSGGAAAELVFDAGVARSLTVGADVRIQANGRLASAAAGTVTTHALVVGGSVVNEGQLDFSTNADTAGAIVTFGAGAMDVNFAGNGAVTDVRAITIAKGVQQTVVTLNPVNFTVRGAAVDSATAAFLTLTSGTFRIGGTFAMTNRLFSVAAYSIPAAAGLWLDNPNFTVAALNGSPTTTGLLRVSAGTYNVGTGAGNSMGAGAGARFMIEGGALVIAGRLQSTAVVNYTQSGGFVHVCTVGNAAGTACFGLTAAGSTFDFAGGAVVLVIPSTAGTPLDYSVSPSASFLTNPALTNLILGGGGSPAAANYRVLGATPRIQVTAGRTMSVGSTASGGTIFFRGTTLFNEGTIAVQGANSRLDFAASGPMTYVGTGVMGSAGAPFTGVGISANSPSGDNTTINAPIFVNRVNFFNGGFTNSGLLTLGGGGATTAIVQMGNSTTPSNAGGFDVSPAFDLGTGGQIMLYLRQTTPRVSGPEINPTRTLSTLTIDENNPAHSVTLSGGDLAVTAIANLTNGRLITGANTLSTGTVAVARTNGYVDGNLRRTATAVGALTFDVGSVNGYSPVAFNVTAGTLPADITASAVQATAPGFMPPELAIGRHWSLDATDITADLTFSYLDPTDLGMLDETGLRVYRGVAGVYSDLGGTINDVANTATIADVTTFSEWTLGAALIGNLSIDPGSINFGDVVVDDTSLAATVTLSNTGFASLDVTDLDAASAPFERSGGSCSMVLPITIAVGEDCTLEYTFSPTATGPSTQTLTVTADAPGSGTIQLDGNGVQGNLVIDPSGVDFGDVLVGTTSGASMVTLSNDGNASLDVTVLTAATAPFARNGGTCAATPTISIAAGANCTLVYEFSPSATGAADQTLTVTANAPGSGTIQLDGNGVQGNLVIDPGSIDFGDVVVGASSAASTVTLMNTGTASLDVTALTEAAAPFARNGGTCPATPTISIAAGGNCTLIYEFSPTASGVADQTLTVTANAPGSGSIQLDGNAVEGNLVIAPGSIDFGDVGIGSDSAVQTVTLSNNGTANLEVTDLTVAAAPFALSGGTCGGAPFTIPNDASCTLQFTFSPSIVGPADQTLSVTADAPGSGSIQLDGNGVQGNLVIDPASLDLGDTVIGDVSAVGTITLSNDGDVPLEVNSITLADLPFVRTNDGSCGNALPFTINNGESCTLSYTFAPTDAGPAQQGFTVGSNASGDSSFELLGSGLPAEIEIFFDGFEPIP